MVGVVSEELELGVGSWELGDRNCLNPRWWAVPTLQLLQLRQLFLSGYANGAGRVEEEVAASNGLFEN
jgi:hypothetical protein